MYKILSFDGGGIRSVFTARLLARLEAENDLVRTADMIAGNSGGAIVAGALACGYNPVDIVIFFRQEGPVIFQDSLADDVGDLFDLTGARYEESHRLDVFQRYFRETRLSDFERRIVIPAFDLGHHSGRWKPMSFHNFVNSRYKDLTVTEAVMASSAAQTYFPVYRLGDSKFADGGVWANNPSMAALTEALNSYRGGQKLEDIVILNVGTILNKITLETPKIDMGIYDWVNHGLIDLMLDSGAMDAVAYYCRGVLGPRYHRLNMLTDEEIKLDDTDKIQRLINLADGVDLEPVRAWLQGFWV
jgi:hypothetical protein